MNIQEEGVDTQVEGLECVIEILPLLDMKQK
jgi:hypothetical protein